MAKTPALLTLIGPFACLIGASFACAPRPFGPWTQFQNSDRRIVAPVLRAEACDNTSSCAMRIELHDEQTNTWSFELPPRSKATPTQHWWLLDSGQSQPATECEGAVSMDSQCQTLTEPLRAKAELLILDANPADCPALRLQEWVVQSIIDREPAPGRGHPRWLVLNRPVESAGATGLGTRRGTDTFLQLPQALQRLILGGYVDGVIASSEDGSEFITDLGEAVQRSSHQWLKAPVFQIVVGQNRLSPWQRMTRSSSAYQPQLWSRKQGLAVELNGWADPNCDIEVIFYDEAVRKNRPKKQATFHVPRIAAPHSLLRQRAHVEPCLGCKARRVAPPYVK